MQNVSLRLCFHCFYELPMLSIFVEIFLVYTRQKLSSMRIKITGESSYLCILGGMTRRRIGFYFILFFVLKNHEVFAQYIG